MTAISVPYLGMPPNMRALPSPRPGSTLGAPSMGDAVSTSLGGTTSVFRNLYPRRTFNLSYGNLAADEARVLLNFYQGLYGLGPFALVDSSARNMLGFDVSTCGARSYASHGWVASSGTLAAGSSPPEQADDSGVLVWSSPSASATLHPGTAAATADTLTAPPNLPAEFCTASLWIKSATSSTATLQLAGYDSAGAFVAALSQAAITTTAWSFVSVTAGPYESALASCAYLIPRLVLGASVPASVSFAAAQLEYGDAPTGWEPGASCPRVVITSSPGRDLPLVDRSDHTLALAE